MKKLLFFFLLAFCVETAVGQTYYYKYLYHVNKDTGVKTKFSSFEKQGGIYITFANNKSNCYESDKDGFKGQYSSVHKYKGTNNGRHTYYHNFKDDDPNNPFFQQPWYDIPSYYYFSSDFKRLNRWSDHSKTNITPKPENNIIVYELSTAPKTGNNEPDVMY